MKWLYIASVVMFVGALVIAPLVVIRLPADYFAGKRRESSAKCNRHPILRWLFRGTKTALGVALVLAGITMLVLPGQGILTILVGLTLLEFPGKYRLERWIVRRRPLILAINHLRARSGRPPLQLNSESGDTASDTGADASSRGPCE
jgi:hypothetical protein